MLEWMKEDYKEKQPVRIGKKLLNLFYLFFYYKKIVFVLHFVVLTNTTLD